MRIFISWSGERSRAVAEYLHVWLKDVLHKVDPWVSTADISVGALWNVEVARKLEEARFGILCITKENLREPWLLFEAGALTKKLDSSLVCPLLFDLEPSELTGPLVQFQAARAVESDMRRMVQSINRALENDALPAERVDRAFRMWWPQLDDLLGKIPSAQPSVPSLRPDRELLEEILDRVRRVTITGALKQSEGLDKLAPSIGGDLFEGRDVEALLARLDDTGGNEDRNATLWSAKELQNESDALDGRWNSRWNGGVAFDSWVTGVGQVQTYGEHVYVITHDARADSLIATRRISQDRLAGRYINLHKPSEVLAWVGKIVSNDRIDGVWTQGRWDLRRHE